MESIGGNKSEGVSDKVISHNDGTFSLHITSASTSGSINTACSGTFPGGGPGSFFYRRYNATGTTVLNEYCASLGSSFYPEFSFPQPNGDTIFIGHKNSQGDDIAIERRSGTGIILWTKFYGGSGGEGLADVTALADGSFLVLTASNSNDGDVGQHYGSDFSADIWVFKIDNNGNFIWGKVLGGSGGDTGQLLFTAEDGNFYILGGTGSTNFDATGNHGGSDLLVIKLDSSGNKLWHRCLGGTGSDSHFIKALRDNSGGFYILSWTNSQDGDVQQRLPDSLFDFWLVHIDSTAGILWENTYGGPSTQMPFALCRATDGSLWMGGYTSAVIGGMVDAAYGMSDAWVVHADSQGNFINQRSFGNNKEDQIDMLHPLPDGTVLAGGRYRQETTPGPSSAGFPQTSEGELDIFLTRLGPQTVGVKDKILEPSVWELFPNPSNNTLHIRVRNGGKEEYNLVIVDASGNIRLKNTFRDKLELDISQWQPGIYGIILNDQSGNTGAKKFVVAEQ